MINIGSGESISIKSLSKKISKILKFKGKIFFDDKYPDGTLRKNLDSSIIRSLGWRPKISLDLGLEKSIDYYIRNK